jgi:hypothetical protein
MVITDEEYFKQLIPTLDIEGDEWMGGSYDTYDNLAEKVKEALEND